MNNKYNGLSNSEVEKKWQMYGKNIIDFNTNNKFKENSLLIIKNPIFILLFVTIILYMVLKANISLLILCITLIILLIIKTIQTLKINKTEKQIKNILSDYCSVIRNGKEERILFEDVTIDDILILKEGDKVCADAIILEDYNLYTDESCFTNDYTHVEKSNSLLNPNSNLKSNYVYKGTYITKGYGIAKVISIGNNTKIAKNNPIINTNNKESKLQLLTKKLSTLCIITSIIGFILTFIICILLKIELAYSLINSISISLICLFTNPKFNVRYLLNNEKEILMNKNSIIDDYLTIENINKLTYLFIEQENFICENKILIKQICPLVESSELITNALLSTPEYDYELYKEAYKNYLGAKNIHFNKNEYRLIKKYKYSEKTKMCANIYEYENENYIYAMGDLESIYDICELDLSIKYQLHNIEKEYQKQGLEIIAIASKKVDKIESKLLNYDNLKFSGIIGLYKPLKENIKEVIKNLQEKNIKIIMVSKSNKNIAGYIGKQIGINNYKNIITEKELEKLNKEDLNLYIKDLGIICETTTHNKNIINYLKNSDEMIGLTCNEVKEQEIIKNINLLISTKENRTDITKDLSNITLLKNDLSIITEIMNYSKLINHKIKKFILYNFIIHILLITLIILNTIFKLNILLNVIGIIIIEIIVSIFITLKNKI